MSTGDVRFVPFLYVLVFCINCCHNFVLTKYEKQGKHAGKSIIKLDEKDKII